MYPDRVKSDALYAGQVGYIICDTKNVQDTVVGDTFHHQGFCPDFFASRRA